MNKDLKKLGVNTYHSANFQIIKFELHGLKYFAKKEWNSLGETTSVHYGRELHNEYFDTISTIRGGTGGMDNRGICCIFGKMPEDLYDEILSS